MHAHVFNSQQLTICSPMNQQVAHLSKICCPWAKETNSNNHKKVCMHKNRPYSTCGCRVYNAASTNTCIVWGLAFLYPVPRLMCAVSQAMVLCAVLHKLTRYLCSPPWEEVGRPMYRSVCQSLYKVWYTNYMYMLILLNCIPMHHVLAQYKQIHCQLLQPLNLTDTVCRLCIQNYTNGTVSCTALTKLLPF